MIKALLKKQLREVISLMFRNKRNEQKMSKTKMASYIIVYTVLFAIVAVVFFSMANIFCKPFLQVGLDWLYFVIMGTALLRPSICLGDGNFGATIQLAIRRIRIRKTDSSACGLCLTGISRHLSELTGLM